MCDPSVPSYFDPDDPSLDPEKALCLEMALDAHMLWPEDAEELIKLTNDIPTSGRAWRPVLLRQATREGEPTGPEAERWARSGRYVRRFLGLVREMARVLSLLGYSHDSDFETV